MYNKICTSAQFIQSKHQSVPQIGVVLGSGLSEFANTVSSSTILPFGDIPSFLPTSVEGHPGKLILGKIANLDVVIMQGRLHAYEGHKMHDIVFPIRVLGKLGVKIIILTNAAGGINTTFTPGDLVSIDDHINLMGTNPLIGPNIAELGPRFPDMTQAYDPKLREIAKKAAQKIELNLKNGIYGALLGPTYETPAEIRMLRILGADMVGMSTVPETITANHLGIKVLGISCITNMAAGLSGQKLNHEDIKTEANRVIKSFAQFLTTTIIDIGFTLNNDLYS